ncbi:MAG TPA: hypothetical protein VNN73_03455 [Blastocatellia bacterium]|nr:hypothetical protein [Blastocatellia bacterium]
MANEQFDKDFGYLMPFLDKIAAAGRNLSDPAARNEFAQLIAGEKAKWARIRELLSGAQGQAVSKTGGDQNRPQADSGNDNSVAIKGPFAFTVGSLRPRKQ